MRAIAPVKLSCVMILARVRLHGVLRSRLGKGAEMKKVAVSLVALVLAAGLALPALAQDVASIEPTAIVIAPPLTPLARTIKDGLAEAYYGATRDSVAYAEAQKLYFLYGERHFEPIWIASGNDGAIAFSPAAQKIVDLFKRAGEEGLRPTDY